MFRAGDTYAYPPDIDEDTARATWTGEPHKVFVAEGNSSNQILGTYYLTPNFQGPGEHVCNCGYIVSAMARGKGIATAMCKHSQQHALEQGYLAMQFNYVASSNTGAIRLWKKLGFDIVGTLPGAFLHSEQGFIDAFVMYKQLTLKDID